MFNTTIIYYEGVCPGCGCEDIRDKGWYFECFKCGYTEKPSRSVAVKYEAVEEAITK